MSSLFSCNDYIIVNIVWEDIRWKDVCNKEKFLNQIRQIVENEEEMDIELLVNSVRDCVEKRNTDTFKILCTKLIEFRKKINTIPFYESLKEVLYKIIYGNHHNFLELFSKISGEYYKVLLNIPYNDEYNYFLTDEFIREIDPCDKWPVYAPQIMMAKNMLLGGAPYEHMQSTNTDDNSTKYYHYNPTNYVYGEVLRYFKEELYNLEATKVAYALHKYLGYENSWKKIQGTDLIFKKILSYLV